MLAMLGMITPQYVLMRPSDFINRKSGSIATCTGITSPALIARKTQSLPRNLSFANAYPAIEFTISDSTVTTIEMIPLFTR